MVEVFVWTLKITFLTLFLVSEVFCGVVSLLWFLEEKKLLQTPLFLVVETQNLKIIVLLASLFFSAFCLFCFTRLEKER